MRKPLKAAPAILAQETDPLQASRVMYAGWPQPKQQQDNIVQITDETSPCDLRQYEDSVLIIDADQCDDEHHTGYQFKCILKWLDAAHRSVQKRHGALLPCIIVATSSEELAQTYQDEILARGAAIEIKPQDVKSFTDLKQNLIDRYGVEAPDGTTILRGPYRSALARKEWQKMQEEEFEKQETHDRIRQYAESAGPVSEDEQEDRFYLLTGQEDKLIEKYFGPLAADAVVINTN